MSKESKAPKVISAKELEGGLDQSKSQAMRKQDEGVVAKAPKTKTKEKVAPTK